MKATASINTWANENQFAIVQCTRSSVVEGPSIQWLRHHFPPVPLSIDHGCSKSYLVQLSGVIVEASRTCGHGRSKGLKSRDGQEILGGAYIKKKGAQVHKTI